MSIDELAVMDGGKCIVQVRGVRPFLSSKYDLTQHPNYPLTADARVCLSQCPLFRKLLREMRSMKLKCEDLTRNAVFANANIPFEHFLLI